MSESLLSFFIPACDAFDDKNRKCTDRLNKVPVGTTMRQGSRLIVAEEVVERMVGLVDNIAGPHEAWGCVIF